MKDLSFGQKILRSILVAIIVPFPLAACVWVARWESSPLKEPAHIVMAFVLPSALLLLGINLLYQVWKK